MLKMGLLNLKIIIYQFLTSSILILQILDKTKQQDLLKNCRRRSNKAEINDQAKYLVDQKIEVLRSLN